MNRSVWLVPLVSCAALVFATGWSMTGCQSRESNRTAVPRSNEGSNRSAASQRFEFTRLIAHWSGYADSGYLPFVDDVKPEVVQVGFYGAHFWSLADTTSYGGYPANLPVRGHRECGEWFARLNSELHRRGLKVAGHMNVKFLVGDPNSPEGPRGFFRFYRDQWDEALPGPKPVVDPIDLLEKDKTGKPISNQTYSIGGMREYWACLNNPHWRQVFKAWVRCGTDRKNPGNGIKNEKPIAAPASQADLNLNRKQRVRHIEFLTPETDQSRELEFEQSGSRLRFRVPEFLVMEWCEFNWRTDDFTT